MVRHDIKKPKPEGDPISQPEPYKPMAVSAPSDKERIEALELQFGMMKKKFNELDKQHHMHEAR